MSKKGKRRNQNRASLSMARALFLKIPNLVEMNHRQRKKVVKTLLGKLCWPSYLASEGLTKKWDDFWADRKKTVVADGTAGTA